MRTLSPSAFSAAAPGTAAAKRLTSQLESAAITAIMDAVARAAHDQVAQLNAAGHRFEPDDAQGPLAFRSVLPDGAVLTLDLQLVGSASVRYLSAVEHAEALAAQSTAEEDQFYRTLAAARAVAGADGIAALTPEQRLVFVIGGLEAELQNGGFEQYFLNSAGDHAAEALVSLERVGAEEAARVLREAMKAFPEGSPADRTQRERLVAAMSKKVRAKWETLSSRFYARGEPLAQVVGEWLAGAS